MDETMVEQVEYTPERNRPRRMAPSPEEGDLEIPMASPIALSTRKYMRSSMRIETPFSRLDVSSVPRRLRRSLFASPPKEQKAEEKDQNQDQGIEIPEFNLDDQQDGVQGDDQVLGDSKEDEGKNEKDENQGKEQMPDVTTRLERCLSFDIKDDVTTPKKTPPAEECVTPKKKTREECFTPEKNMEPQDQSCSRTPTPKKDRKSRCSPSRCSPSLVFSNTPKKYARRAHISGAKRSAPTPNSAEKARQKQSREHRYLLRNREGEGQPELETKKPQAKKVQTPKKDSAAEKGRKKDKAKEKEDMEAEPVTEKPAENPPVEEKEVNMEAEDVEFEEEKPVEQPKGAKRGRKITKGVAKKSKASPRVKKPTRFSPRRSPRRSPTGVTTRYSERLRAKGNAKKE